MSHKKHQLIPDRDLKIDKWGLPYIELRDECYKGGVFLFYVSPCCHAAVTVSFDGAMCCKCCWEEVDGMLGGYPEPKEES